ncbi:hypothetical protein PCANC_25151 [Puccinia coronata f. sp. avenae]|uniref:Uncharacterized protein n=1 Tax=Puccinia coronata f. sp. avenae TaxID=200324 RepID=A0A2N5S3W8_9BASI|nr:hypothetical protein PCANC_25151 [Puccinia coronata f. sp. avenae]
MCDLSAKRSNHLGSDASCSDHSGSVLQRSLRIRFVFPGGSQDQWHLVNPSRGEASLCLRKSLSLSLIAMKDGSLHRKYDWPLTEKKRCQPDFLHPKKQVG